MSKHTPGPWEPKSRWTPTHCAGIVVAPGRGKQGGAPAPLTIAYVGPNIRGKSDEHRTQMEANALLISTAPEMAKLLEDIAKDEEHFPSWAWSEARTVLKKAGLL